jgi:methionine-rich copper-binding protein CopC
MFAMNLALQTRRAVITLTLMALAMMCVAAKTATRHDALSADAPTHVESMAADRVQVSITPVAVIAAAKTSVRCETRIVRI